MLSTISFTIVSKEKQTKNTPESGDNPAALSQMMDSSSYTWVRSSSLWTTFANNIGVGRRSRLTTQDGAVIDAADILLQLALENNQHAFGKFTRLLIELLTKRQKRKADYAGIRKDWIEKMKKLEDDSIYWPAPRPTPMFERTPVYQPGTKLDTFTCFPELPAELKQQILRLAVNFPQVIEASRERYLEPKVIRLSRFAPRRQSRPFENLLLTSKEIREQVQKHLIPLDLSLPTVFINPCVDLLLFENPFEWSSSTHRVRGTCTISPQIVNEITSMAISASPIHEAKSSTFTLASAKDLKLEYVASRLQSGQGLKWAFPKLKELYVCKNERILRLNYGKDGQWKCCGYVDGLSALSGGPDVETTNAAPNLGARKMTLVQESRWEKQDRIRTMEMVEELGAAQPAFDLPQGMLEKLMPKVEPKSSKSRLSLIE